MKHKMTGNRKAMRRAFSFLLATVLVMSVLAGCGHAEPMTEAPPETAEDLAQDALLAGQAARRTLPRSAQLPADRNMPRKLSRTRISIIRRERPGSAVFWTAT